MDRIGSTRSTDATVINAGIDYIIEELYGNHAKVFAAIWRKAYADWENDLMNLGRS